MTNTQKENLLTGVSIRSYKRSLMVNIVIQSSVLYHWYDRFGEIANHGIRQKTDPTYKKILDVSGKVYAPDRRSFCVNIDKADWIELLEEVSGWLDTESDISLGIDDASRKIRAGYTKLRVELNKFTEKDFESRTFSNEEKAILGFLDENSGFITRDLTSKAKISSSQETRRIVLILKSAGLIKELDDQKPVAWCRTAAGTKALETGYFPQG
jgi:hypothetical protein